MSDPNSPDYYRNREQQCRDFAAKAKMPEVRHIHEEMAGHYARLLREMDPRVRGRMPHIATPSGTITSR